MQTDARLIPNVKGAYQRTSQGCNQVYSLALATGKSIRGSVQGKISKSYILDISETRGYLLNRLFSNLSVCVVQVYILKKIQELIDIHAQ